MGVVVLWCFGGLFAVALAQDNVPVPPSICEPGRYGANCELTCDNCKTPKCTKINGQCPGGCKDGWNPSDAMCNTPCDGGTYGPGCVKKCSPNCLDPKVCNKQNGACTCKSGFHQSPDCKPCNPGKYGPNCATICGKCQGGNATCDKVNGQCREGCLPGYSGRACHDKCTKGRWGKDCKEICRHCHPAGAACNHITGTCPTGCLSGFKPSKCAEGCDPGGWGRNCLSVCSQHCQDPSACDAKHGYCTCKPGYRAPNCRAPCEGGQYGEGCGKRCGECADGSSQCHHISGNCTQCEPHRQMPLCQDCVPGKFGTFCHEDCGSCGGNGGCARDSGVCTTPKCQPGWRSPKCDQKCPDGWYGQDCSQKCGRCGNGTACRHDNGVCERDCEEGYEGVMCQRAEASMVGLVVGALFGAAVLIALAIVGSVCFLKRRRNSKSKSMPTCPSKEYFTTMGEMASTSQEEDQGIVAPPSPSTADAYQNVQVNHISEENTLHEPVMEMNNPSSAYDRMDMLKRAQETHQYESHAALHNPAHASAADTASSSLLQQQQQQNDDNLYQNAAEVLAFRPAAPSDVAAVSGPQTDAAAAALAEPEATYGNLVFEK